MMTINELEEKCKQFIIKDLGTADAAHDLEHIQRVVANAKKIALTVNAKQEILIPAAWLHDCVCIPKDSKDRSRASKLAAEKAIEFLKSINYNIELISEVYHTIEAHSFSSGVKAESLEAKVLQDADRLDALGAIGIARTLAVGYGLRKSLYDPADPLAENREPDDSRFSVDHFFVKLFKLPAMMNTEFGKTEALNRVEIMQGFLRSLRAEVLI